MHEISLVHSIFRTLREQFPDKMDDVLRVKIKAGLLSNVQPLLMQSAWEAVLECEMDNKDIRLEMEMLPVLIECSRCGKVSQVDDYVFICSCGEPCRNIIQGQELLISEVEFEE
ncbi:MAG TPA: hydrogenase maturation nickel metallochaperone HypA [Phnomibacter sp.]|nr:hydrogenase maturation nickel metallochaperone HypA [Phnomibacter sp.]